VIDAKGIAQYALLLCRQLEKLTPFERFEVIGVAASLIQVEVQREIRRRQDPAGFVEDEP
jgi:hypothetical protein